MGVAVGLDVCPGGWVAAVIRDAELAAIEFHDSARGALNAYPHADGFAFDIPIGLSPHGRRAADAEARRFLGERANSVFWAPPCPVLDVERGSFPSRHEAYAEARRVALRGSGGRYGLSSQSFALAAKIREVDALARDDRRVHEAHPEVSFHALAREGTLPSKKTWDGLMRRMALLSSAGIGVPDPIGEASARSAADDIVDAMVCAWTAARIARGEARPLPDPPERLGGRAVAIWY